MEIERSVCLLYDLGHSKVYFSKLINAMWNDTCLNHIFMPENDFVEYYSIVDVIITATVLMGKYLHIKMIRRITCIDIIIRVIH